MLALKPFGMQVKVTEHIKGLVPRLHLADVLLKQPEKKYSVGSTVRCRVRTLCKGPLCPAVVNIRLDVQNLGSESLSAIVFTV